MKRKSWLTADHHFGHDRIRTLCNRPFSSLGEMHGALIAAWNERVAPDDVVYHLGDYGAGETAAGVFHALNGEKHLIVGNHDDEIVRSLPWASVHEDHLDVIIDHQRVYLRHYPVLSWPSIKKTIHAYGHMHGKIRGWDKACDVGVDCWKNYAPISVQEMMRRLKTLPVNPFYANDPEAAEDDEPAAPAPGMR